MTTRLSRKYLVEISGFISSHMGLHFAPERWRDLERGLQLAAAEFAFSDVESLIDWLLSSALTKKQIGLLSSHLTVGETYFFREQSAFDLFMSNILPDLIHRRQKPAAPPKIWSAGCCSGEEPYSIAISLCEGFGSPKHLNVEILATDINPRYLDKARRGVYTEWSFRSTPPEIRRKYFRKSKGNNYEILDEIKEMVTFSRLNLADFIYPSAQTNTLETDVIFCRNVLMYFAPRQAKKVVENLHRSLIDGGWLIVSPSETSIVHLSAFTTVNYPGAVLFRKNGKDSGRVDDSWSPVSADEILSRNSMICQSSDDIPMPVSEFEHILQPSFLPDLAGQETAEWAEDSSANEPQLAATRNADKESAQPDAPGISPDGNAAIPPIRSRANQGRLAEALESCEKAIAADKTNPELYYLQGMIFQETGSIDQASSSLKRALYLDPQFVAAYLALGYLARREGRTKESDKYFCNAFAVLRKYPLDDLVPHTDGLTVARVMEMIRSAVRI